MNDEIDYTEFDRERLLHFLKLRDRQAGMSRDAWIRAAQKALDGDLRELRTLG